MNSEGAYLAVRAAALYCAASTALMASAWRRPSSRLLAGAALATAWNLPALLALHVAAGFFGWWQFEARGGLLLGMPVDLYLAWAFLWGLVPALAFPSMPITIIAALALALDLILMSAAAPLVRLGEWWIVGEVAGLFAALVPAQLLARWTAGSVRLVDRTRLQVVAFTGLVVFVIPAVVLESTGGAWRNPLLYPAWQVSLIAHGFAIPGLLGLTAVQEFVERGGGTPVPFDPPQRLVTTGVYAYLRNPMQLAGVLVLLLLGLAVHNGWISAAGLIAHIYAVGLAGWDEDGDLRQRFGERWVRYRSSVRTWIPRWRPWYPSDLPPARLYVAGGCDMCRQVGHWFARRTTQGLVIVDAESHPSRALRRITYAASDGAPAVFGVAAIARALEHTHFGWALVGFLMRLPIVGSRAQLLVDASGGEPRPPAPLHRDSLEEDRRENRHTRGIWTDRDDARTRVSSRRA